MNIVDDPYMVRVEALQQLGATGDAFRELAKAWIPKGEMPTLRDLFAAMALQELAGRWQQGSETFAEIASKQAYEYADALMKARKL